MEKRRLIVNIIEARSLGVADISGMSDPFATVFLGKKKIGKTHYINYTLNPKWNETFSYNYESDFTEELRIEINDHDAIGGNDLLGSVNIDLIIFRDGRWTDQWYRLYMDNKPGKGYVRLRVQLLKEGDTVFDPGLHDTQAEVNEQVERQKIRENAIIRRRQLLIQQHRIEKRNSINDQAWREGSQKKGTDDPSSAMIVNVENQYHPPNMKSISLNTPRIPPPLFYQAIAKYMSVFPENYKQMLMQNYINHMNEDQKLYYAALDQAGKEALMNHLMFQQIQTINYYNSLNGEQKEFYKKQMTAAREFIQKNI